MVIVAGLKMLPINLIGEKELVTLLVLELDLNGIRPTKLDLVSFSNLIFSVPELLNQLI